MRLNRYLARSGIASRRKCDLLIQQGAITVNGRVVEDAGRSVAVNRDRVQVHGRNVVPPRVFEYLVINKPAGCLVTRSDTHGRPTVFERVAGLRAGTVAVGRLDRDTTGLLLLTDDGVTAPARVRLLHHHRAVRGHDERRLEITIREGRKRQIRRMVEAIGHPARALQRVEFAGLPLRQLKVGEYRRLRAGEVKRIRALVGL